MRNYAAPNCCCGTEKLGTVFSHRKGERETGEENMLRERRRG
jgi:hypothetical protein